MIVIALHRSATRAQRLELVDVINSSGSQCHTHTSTLLSASGEVGQLLPLLKSRGYVANVANIPAEYPRASIESRCGRTTVVPVGNTSIGGSKFAVIAGPCSVESEHQLLTTAEAVRDAGADVLRGGAFKPRSSPYSFQGLGRAGLRLLANAREATGLPVVTEVMDVREIDTVAGAADMVQIGARNMQNYPLLREVGQAGCPVLLKRGLAATVDETLLAAEYVLDAGNDQVILCERGIRTFETAYRFTLDLAGVTVLKERTHLPVIVDPSHAAGETQRVIPLALGAAAAGADGVILESHHDPDKALCDGNQALPTSQLPNLMQQLELAAAAAGRRLDELGAPTRRTSPLVPV